MPSEFAVASGGVDGIPFGFLCSLFREISTIKPVSINVTTIASRNQYTSYGSSYPALTTFKRWFAKLQQRYSPLPEGTVGSVLRLMFPEEDGRRKYELREERLARSLERCLGLGEGVLGGGGEGECCDDDCDCDGGCSPNHREDGSGWLGLDVESVLKEKCQLETNYSSFTIAQIDELLDELSATSTFTHSTIRSKYPHHRSKLDILRSLYRPLSPLESKIVTQIILKDLQPILYPYPSQDNNNYSKALLGYDTRSMRMLRIEDVMGVWDSTGFMGKLWRVRGEMDDVVREFEECVDESLRWRALRPKLGNMIKLPKNIKGRNCHHALSYFRSSTATVWAETKYDGERAQIHVEILEGNDGMISSNIRIWSKSGRESTWDRLGVHGIVRDALGLNNIGRKERRVGGKFNLPSSMTTVKKNVVLDAEMVAWYKDHVDEFWRIRRLIGQTASGPRGRTLPRKHQHDDSQDEDPDSQSSMVTGDSQSRHLALIFFDILVLDDEPLIFEPYATRRQRLESLIKVIPTKAMLSDRYPIQMSLYNNNDPHRVLQKIFAERLANHMEGLILKADESQYNEYGLPWVKLKKDYIQGFGDCVDLVVVGAGWDRDRARELRVAPNVFTTFFVGVITNLKDCQLQPNIKPHILIYFTVSYGLNRKELEDLNFRIKNDENVLYPPSIKDLDGFPFTFNLASHLKSKPKVILRIPFLAEMVFAGFDKSKGCKYYEPRFPRITKIHDKRERPWSTCMDMTELDKIARECVGRDRSEKEVDDWCRSLWGLPTSPTVGMKRRMRVGDILGKLVDVESSLMVEGESMSRRGLRCELDLKRRRLSRDRLERNELLVSGLTLGGLKRGEEHGEGMILGIASGGPQVPERVLHEDRIVEEVSPNWMLLSASVSCFINSRSDRHGCVDCLRWKKAIPKERRVHSLEALLTACKAGGGGGRGDTRPGMIFVDVSDAIGIQRTIDTVRNNAGDVKIRVLVFACNVDRLLKEENALLVV